MRSNADYSGVFLFIMETNIEIWRDVPCFEGMYQCSSFGRIVSIKTGFNQRKDIKVKILDNGYSNVQLTKSTSQIGKITLMRLSVKTGVYF